MKIYLAGPMTGKPNYNYDEFNSQADHLRAHGYDVLNPAETDNGTSHKPRAFYLREALKMLLECDTIALLSDWESSRGACLEVLIAGELGMKIVDAYTLSPIEADMHAASDVLIPSPPKEPESILQEAQRLVHGDRGRAYGHPFDNHSRTANYWSVYKDMVFTPEDVCWMNILQKISRDQNMPKRDNATDTAGYAENLQLVRERRAEMETK